MFSQTQSGGGEGREKSRVKEVVKNTFFDKTKRMEEKETKEWNINYWLFAHSMLSNIVLEISL